MRYQGNVASVTKNHLVYKKKKLMVDFANQTTGMNAK